MSARGRTCTSCLKATRRAQSRKQVVSNYGLTPKEYAAILELQGGVCAICKEPRTYSLAVDHDHKVEANWSIRASVRGLLCKRCNKLLAMIRDNPDIARNAADYLLNWPACDVLFSWPSTSDAPVVSSD